MNEAVQASATVVATSVRMGGQSRCVAAGFVCKVRRRRYARCSQALTAISMRVIAVFRLGRLD